LIKKSPLKKEG